MMKRAICFLIGFMLISSVFAADLSEFPDMFLDNDRANVLVIVGKAAKADDVIGAIDIVVALQHEVGNKKLDIARMDNEVDVISAQNTIIIGGPCANAAAAKLLGYPENCLEGFELGKGYINLYEFENDNIAMLIAGTVAIDTRRVTRVIANYKDYELKGNELVVSDINLREITITPK